MMLALLSLSLVSAHSTYYDVDDGYTYKEKIVETKYYPGEHRTYSRTTYINYDNDKRYSTYDYRHGYSYRTTIEYRDRHYPAEDYYKNYRGYYEGYKNYRRGSKDYYYEYAPHLREYRKKGCYNSPPEGKLFYIRCP